MGPACAVVDATGDQVMLWTGSQKAHYTAEGVERILKLKPGAVRGSSAVGVIIERGTD